jgi:hypothetical protein
VSRSVYVWLRESSSTHSFPAHLFPSCLHTSLQRRTYYACLFAKHAGFQSVNLIDEVYTTAEILKIRWEISIKNNITNGKFLR